MIRKTDVDLFEIIALDVYFNTSADHKFDVRPLYSCFLHVCTNSIRFQSFSLKFKAVFGISTNKLQNTLMPVSTK